VKLWVVDRQVALNRLQVLLARNAIPEAGSSWEDAEEQSKAGREPQSFAAEKQAASSQLVAVYVEASNSQLQSALDGLAKEQQTFLGLAVQQPVELASIDAASRKEFEVADALLKPRSPAPAAAFKPQSVPSDRDEEAKFRYNAQSSRETAAASGSAPRAEVKSEAVGKKLAPPAEPARKPANQPAGGQGENRAKDASLRNSRQLVLPAEVASRVNRFTRRRSGPSGPAAALGATAGKSPPPAAAPAASSPRVFAGRAAPSGPVQVLFLMQEPPASR
jgi:hypothetical protein